jgi:hypothetical protein
MAKNNFLSWDTTAGNNKDVGGVNIDEGCPPSGINNAIREVMAQLRADLDSGTVYAAKNANYTALANDNNAFHRYTAVSTLSLTAAATLGADWHYTLLADGADVTIDPNGAELVNGLATLRVPNGSCCILICSGTAFFAVVFGNPQTGAQLQGYSTGLALTTNASDAANDVDISAGAVASDTSPYYLMQLSALTKRIDAAWSVGTNQGGLDTGSIGNNVYYIWLIQRSDTGVTDVLFSLSATAPTMPTNYDRKRLIGSLARVSASNTGLYSQLGALRSIPPIALNTLSEAPFLLPAGTRVARIYFTALSTTGTVIPQAQIGTASAYATSGYVGSANSLGSSNVPNAATIGVPLAGDIAAVTSLNGYIEFANVGGNSWIATGVVGAGNTALNVVVGVAITLSDVATRVRLNLTSTTFDSGTAFVVCM